LSRGTSVKMIEFSVYGIPVAKGRPKFARMGNFVKAYTPLKTREAEESFVSQAIKFKPTEPIKGAIKLDLTFISIKPKSAKKRIYWEVRPDLDNLVKLVKDALNGIFWVDDSQIILLSAEKRYGTDNSTEVGIVEINDDNI